MSRYFVDITPESLIEKITNAFQKHEEFCDEIDPAHAKSLTPTIEKDLNKIEFCSENGDFEPDQNEMTVQTLSSGLNYVAFSAGGDWEHPVYFIIYWDGTKLRAYIPATGNIYNHSTKMAFGNHDADDDPKGDNNVCKKNYGTEEWYDLEFDEYEIQQDILKRIVRKS